MENITTIQLGKVTRDLLKSAGVKGQSYDQIICDLLLNKNAVDYWKGEHDRIYHAFVNERKDGWVQFGVIQELNQLPLLRTRMEERGRIGLHFDAPSDIDKLEADLAKANEHIKELSALLSSPEARSAAHPA